MTGAALPPFQRLFDGHGGGVRGGDALRGRPIVRGHSRLDGDIERCGATERARGSEDVAEEAAVTSIGPDSATRQRFQERAQAAGLVDVAFATMDSPVGTLLL